MEQRPTISEEFFEELLVDAIGDLQNSGLAEDQVFVIIRDLFGPDYAHRFCGESGNGLPVQASESLFSRLQNCLPQG